MRGHQLGYRPKVNTYDGWTPAQFEQYIRDLAVFGTNAIELIPPRSDDDEDSPHFLLKKIDMMEEVSRICDAYGIDVWIWFPAMDKDYANPAIVEFALKQWDEVYSRLPRIDAIFVPGGDPGHTRPKYMMALLEKQTALLHQRHANAKMWMSPQSFSTEWMTEWFELMNQKPAWLTGVVYGPQVRIPLPELRAKVPAKYPIRWYPDITHSRQAQYPVPDWDLAFASTEGREVINPRPTQQARIFHLYEKYTAGFLPYSEGVNDDVNKFVWSGLGWNPDTPVVEILRDFGRYFIDWRMADSFAQGLLALERNWVGPLATNASVDTTLTQFQDMERSASPQVLGNWRFQQALYRAYYDSYLRARLLSETGHESAALDKLRMAPRTGPAIAMGRGRTHFEAVRNRPSRAMGSRSCLRNGGSAFPIDSHAIERRSLQRRGTGARSKSGHDRCPAQQSRLPGQPLRSHPENGFGNGQTESSRRHRELDEPPALAASTTTWATSRVNLISYAALASNKTRLTFTRRWSASLSEAWAARSPKFRDPGGHTQKRSMNSRSKCATRISILRRSTKSASSTEAIPSSRRSV